jgi:hypothetical protein
MASEIVPDQLWRGQLSLEAKLATLYLYTLENSSYDKTGIFPCADALGRLPRRL